MPSISAASVAVVEYASDHRERPVEASDIASIVPNTSAVSLRLRVSGPTMNAIDTGISRMPSISSRFENGVGFSSATELFGPYQPPPLEPSCLAATIGATARAESSAP